MYFTCITCRLKTLFRDAISTVQKSRKISCDRGSGVQGQRPVGVEGGKAPLKLALFLNQNCPESHQLTRMVVTHTIHAHTHTKKKREKKKEEGMSEKVRIPTKVGKTASLHTEVERGSGGRAPSGVQGQRPSGGPRGQSPLEARAFSQSELPRKATN